MYVFINRKSIGFYGFSQLIEIIRKKHLKIYKKVLFFERFAIFPLSTNVYLIFMFCCNIFYSVHCTVSIICRDTIDSSSNEPKTTRLLETVKKKILKFPLPNNYHYHYVGNISELPCCFWSTG